MNTGYTIVLASSSPRRRELIQLLRLPYEVMSCDTDESVEPGMTPEQVVETLALRKAQETAQAAGQDALVIGADTIVALDGDILGKPADDADAASMLRRLQGRSHQVYTGVALVDTTSGRSLVRHLATEVWMKPLTEQQIRRYVESGEPRDKAGSYAIQGIGAVLVDSIHGDYFNVVGLPVSMLSEMLKQFGIETI